MEKLELAYLTKNIPIPTERNVKIQLFEKIELFSMKAQWKDTFNDLKVNGNNNINNSE